MCVKHLPFVIETFARDNNNMADKIKLSTLLKLFIKMKSDVNHFQAVFAKPLCGCVTTLPQHVRFWTLCSDCLKRLDGLASLVLDLLCDSSECNCLSKSYFVLDHIRQSVEPLLITMANQKGNIQQQGMQCVVNDHLFARYLESFDKIVFMKINQLLIVLQNCSHKKHENIIVKYGVCPMCE